MEDNEKLAEIIKEFVENQHPLDSDFQEVIEENFWDLI